MTDEVRMFWHPVTMGAGRGKNPSVQVHATLSGSDRMAVELTAAQARGMADVLDAVGAWELASEMREASAWLSRRGASRA